MAYYNISKDEMHTFLTGFGFRPMTIEGTVELVYGKIVTVAHHRLSLRVFTAINPSGESRRKGEDAIRVQLYFMVDGEPRPVGKSQKCLRVDTWEKNLGAAIRRHSEPEYFMVCQKCGAPMIERERQRDKHKFWGCITWATTKCNYTFDADKDTPPAPKADKPVSGRSSYAKPNRPVVQPARTDLATRVDTGMDRFRIPANLISEYQLAVRTAFIEGDDHIIIGARAGGGKTAMLRDLSSFRNLRRFIFLAFGTKNAKEGKDKMPRDVDSRTTHSFCNGLLKSAVTLPEKPDQTKNRQVMEDVYPLMDPHSKERKRIRKASFRLIGLAKNFACRPGDEDAIRAVMDQYAFDLESEAEHTTVVDVVAECLSQSMPGKKFGSVYDFDDMLWWVVCLGLEPPHYDVVLADECQDFNACQVEILRRMAAKGSRIVGVGDPHQAIYRFRGADCDAYDKVKSMLEAEQRGCQEVILPINYRCGRAILAYVRENTHVKDIQAAPDAIEGEVIEGMSYPDVLDMLAKQYGKVA